MQHTTYEKKCKYCNILKNIELFRLRKDTGKFTNTCKECLNNASKIRSKIHYKNNKNYYNNKTKIWQSNNKDKVKISVKKWKDNNKNKINNYVRNRSKIPHIKIRHHISSEIYRSLKRNSCTKSGSIISFLNYSMKDLSLYIESKFEHWMTWDNWGTYQIDKWDDNDKSTWTWQIDHIIPQSKLPYISMKDENFKKCWNLSNLRPYSAKQNVIDNKR